MKKLAMMFVAFVVLLFCLFCVLPVFVQLPSTTTLEDNGDDDYAKLFEEIIKLERDIRTDIGDYPTFSQSEQKRIGTKIDTISDKLQAFKSMSASSNIDYVNELWDWAFDVEQEMNFFMKCIYDSNSRYYCDLADGFYDESRIHYDRAFRMIEE